MKLKVQGMEVKPTERGTLLTFWPFQQSYLIFVNPAFDQI